MGENHERMFSDENLYRLIYVSVVCNKILKLILASNTYNVM